MIYQKYPLITRDLESLERTNRSKTAALMTQKFVAGVHIFEK